MWSARHLSGQVAHPLTLLECPKVVSSYLGRVDKYVRPAVVERNGPEIVSSVEPLHDPIRSRSWTPRSLRCRTRRGWTWSAAFGADLVTCDGLRRADRLDELHNGVLGQVPGDVGLAHDADQAVVVDHGQAPDLVFFHDVEHLLDVGVDVDVVDVALGQLAGGRGGRIQACGKAVDDDVSVGEHSVQAVVVAANRQRADAQVAMC